MELEILYQDSEIIAVNKPSGLLVHRTHLDRGESRFALQVVRDQIGQPVFPVHRLDKPTSGVLLFALSPEAARLLAQEFAGQKVRKEYLAVVRGIPSSDWVQVDHPLREEHDRRADPRTRLDKPAQPAQTDVRCLDSIELPVCVDKYPTSRYALVQARPHTGRRHQVRRHLRHIHHPVIGDVNHGSGKHNRFFANTYGNRRLLLACTQMSFSHPTGGETLTVRAPLCRDFTRVLNELGWACHAP